PHTRSRFVLTMPGSSPPLKPRFRLRNWPRLTPPERSVTATRNPRASSSRDTATVTPPPDCRRSSIDGTRLSRGRDHGSSGKGGDGKDSTRRGKVASGVPPSTIEGAASPLALQEVGDVQVV